MAGIAHLGEFEVIPFHQLEPITLNAARDVQRFLERNHIHSVIAVTPLFRSRRTQLVYASTLGRAGIVVRCLPVEGLQGVGNWTDSWHGIQGVAEQWLKLQYYRAVCSPIPVRSGTTSTGAGIGLSVRPGTDTGTAEAVDHSR